jgi:hypothetical protein
MKSAAIARRAEPAERTLSEPVWRNVRLYPQEIESSKPEPINSWTSLGDVAERILAQLDEMRR